MNVHAPTFPALRRRVVAPRRVRPLFLRPTAQHLERASLAREVGRAALTVAAASGWCAVVALLAA